MSPHGPDLRFVRTSQIPYHLGRVICGQSEGVGKTLIKKLKKNIPTLYVLGCGSDMTNIGLEESGKYWIPCPGAEGEVPR